MTLLIAPAKLTWFLEITGRRDDGYHLIRSEMVSLDLADTLEIHPAAHTKITVTGEAPGVQQVPSNHDNLVVRALAQIHVDAEVTLTKNVPSGAGLGGGSSDAAAVLRWAHCRDRDLAASLGGDVPFCLTGGRALVQGVGEIVTPMEFEERTVTLFMAPFSVNTAACYRAYDELVARTQVPTGRNHLWEASCVVEPRMNELKSFIERETGKQAVLAGSGSTMFVEGDFGSAVDSTTWSSPLGELQVRRARTVPAQAI
jgi:4-diphosphocytidyl-2-C-methyl-D-erythritol kinase